MTMLTADQEDQHDQIIMTLFQKLRNSKAPETYTIAIHTLSELRSASQLAEGPGDTLPLDLVPGDMVHIDGGSYRVTGTPEITSGGNPLLDQYVAVPVGTASASPLMLIRNRFVVTR